MIYLLRKLLSSNFVWSLARENPHGFEIIKDGEVYMQRKTFGKWFGKELRLHRIFLPDPGRHLHDHPFEFRTYLLKGGYTADHTWIPYDSSLGNVGQIKVFTEGDSHKVSNGIYHRITSLIMNEDDDYVATFVVAKWNDDPTDWGFLVDGQHVNYTQYRHLNGN